MMNANLPAGPDTLCDSCCLARESVVQIDQLLRRAAGLLEDLANTSVWALSPEKADKLVRGLPADEVPLGLLAGIGGEHRLALGIHDAPSRCCGLIELARQRLAGLESRRLKDAAQALLTSIEAAAKTGRAGLPGAPWNPKRTGSTWAELKVWMLELERFLVDVSCDHLCPVPSRQGPTLEGLLALAEAGQRVEATLDDLASLLGVTVRRLRDLRRDPDFPKQIASNPKRWNGAEVAKWARAKGRGVAGEEEFSAGLREQMDRLRERTAERNRSASNSLDGESRHKA